jgi:hypothetical protein
MAATEEQLRLLLNDNGVVEILSSTDYALIIGIESNVYAAASLGASTIAAKFALKVSTTTAPVKIAHQQKFDHYMTLEKTYNQKADAGKGVDESEISGNEGLPILTGAKNSDIAAAREDTDRYQETFYRGMNDNPGTYPGDN